MSYLNQDYFVFVLSKKCVQKSWTWVIKKKNINRPAYIFTHPCACSVWDPKPIQLHITAKMRMVSLQRLLFSNKRLWWIVFYRQNSPRDPATGTFSWPSARQMVVHELKTKLLGNYFLITKFVLLIVNTESKGHLSFCICVPYSVYFFAS